MKKTTVTNAVTGEIREYDKDPSAAVVAAWYADHPSLDDFVGRVVAVFRPTDPRNPVSGTWSAGDWKAPGKSRLFCGEEP